MSLDFMISKIGMVLFLQRNLYHVDLHLFFEENIHFLNWKRKTFLLKCVVHFFVEVVEDIPIFGAWHPYADNDFDRACA